MASSAGCACSKRFFYTTAIHFLCSDFHQAKLEGVSSVGLRNFTDTEEWLGSASGSTIASGSVKSWTSSLPLSIPCLAEAGFEAETQAETKVDTAAKPTTAAARASSNVSPTPMDLLLTKPSGMTYKRRQELAARVRKEARHGLTRGTSNGALSRSISEGDKTSFGLKLEEIKEDTREKDSTDGGNPSSHCSTKTGSSDVAVKAAAVMGASKGDGRRYHEDVMSIDLRHSTSHGGGYPKSGRDVVHDESHGCCQRSTDSPPLSAGTTANKKIVHGLSEDKCQHMSEEKLRMGAPTRALKTDAGGGGTEYERCSIPGVEVPKAAERCILSQSPNANPGANLPRSAGETVR